MLAGIGGVLPRVADAYRTGDGVPYPAYGRAFRHGQGHINRPAFTHELPSDWLAAMPDVVARLESAQHPRVADLGCGQGFSTIAIAGAFLNAWVDGLDVDAGSIADARAPRHSSRPRRPRALPRRRRQRAGRPRPLRPHSRPRGAARHEPTPPRRCAPPAARSRPAARCARRRRARGRHVHRPRRRGRADDVRLERHPLPAHPTGRAALGRPGHRHAHEHRPRARAEPATPASTCCPSRTTSSACTGSTPDHRPSSTPSGRRPRPPDPKKTSR